MFWNVQNIRIGPANRIIFYCVVLHRRTSYQFVSVPIGSYLIVVHSYRFVVHSHWDSPPVCCDSVRCNTMRNDRQRCQRTPLCHILLLNLDILQGSFRLCNWLSLRRLVSWINHLPPACWSTFRKSNSKQQLGCRFDIMDYESYFFCVLTYAIIYVMIHPIIFRFYPLKYSSFFQVLLY